MSEAVKLAEFPVAGFGPRFLPATKATPKEMLPVVDKPLIQYAVEEAYEAGIRNMIFVTGRNKWAITEHYDVAYELENELEQRGIRGELLRDTLDSADWFAAARDVYQKKYSAPATTPQERAKRQRFMAQRGFSYEEIRQAMTSATDD